MAGPERPENLNRSSEQLDTTFRIGEETLPYVRQGLNAESARAIAEIIHKISEVDAVAVTDRTTILGYSGLGCYFHVPGRPILTNATRTAIRTGEVKVIEAKPDFECPVEGCPCPLEAAVIAPLRIGQQVVGTVKLYRVGSQTVARSIQRLAIGIAQLLSLQMELGEAERQRELATQARLEALQAQIRPHFLFNTLNTIIHLSRTDPERTRELLLLLATFLRRSLTHKSDFIPLAEELEYIQTYLELEKARFGEKLDFTVRVEPETLSVPVPILTVQPLVENAVVHGLASKEAGGRLAVTARLRRNVLHIVVGDTGVGIPPEKRPDILTMGVGTGMGLGLANVNERLISFYGAKHALRIHSRPGRGTVVRATFPLEVKHSYEWSRTGQA